jgi:mono/diheme cytochrome c family protein
MRPSLALLLALLPAPLAADPAEEGRALFEEACAACHGAAARGDGPTAALLEVPVPDLTRIAWRSGGVFDPGRVVRLIDGRQGLAAHGGPMPMFGGLLTGPAAVVEARDGAPVETTEPIRAIVRWLETQQTETPE